MLWSATWIPPSGPRHSFPQLPRALPLIGGPFLGIALREQSHLAQGSSPTQEQPISNNRLTWEQHHLFSEQCGSAAPAPKLPQGHQRPLFTLHRSHLPSPLPGVTPMSTPHKPHAHLSLFPGELDQPMKEAQG